MFKVKGIIRYPRLFTPKAYEEGDEPKYSAEILIAKNDPTLPPLQTEVNTVLANAFPSGLPPRGTVCLEDCATKYPDKPQLANYMVLKANSGLEFKPETVDANLAPVMDPAQVRTGQIVWAAVNVTSFTKGNKGVKAYLNAVMLTPDMGPIPEEVLSARQSAASIFGGGAPGATPAQPVPPAAAPGTPAPTGAVAPPPAAPAPPPAAPVHQMTPAANSATYEQMIAAGWTDETLIQHGMMLPPGGAAPSFV